ncbi:hypothetical protein [Leisingera sp. JC11]|uniref:hypothetical protein n=1 Tax=Leisingera sp. JC11 TaxID=3042469 RepID=UPI0034543B9B
MKTFTEFLDEQQQIDEGIIRSGSIATLAARSAASGNMAEKAYRKGLTGMTTPLERDDVAARLDRVDAALTALLEGNIYQRRQAGSHIALSVAAHLGNRQKRQRA